MNELVTERKMENNLGGLRSNPSILSNGLLLAQMGSQVVMFTWVLINLLVWSKVDELGEEIIYLLAIPLVLGPILTALMLNARKSILLEKILKKALIYVALAGQIVINWLIYAQIHKLFPLSPFQIPNGEPIFTGWVASDHMTTYLHVLWLNWTLLLVVPTLFGCITSSRPRGAAFKQSFHVGFSIFGIIMALQWGGPWSAPFFQLVLSAGMLPFIVYQLPQTISEEKEEGRIYFPIFSTMGLFFFLGFWLGVPLIHASNQVSTAFTWLLLGVANLVLLWINEKKPGWEREPPGKGALLVTWACMIFGSCAVISINLSSFFAEFRLLWVALGLACIGVVPEMLGMKENTGKKIVAMRTFSTIFLFILGVIIVYALNVFDPLSSYLAYGIIGLFSILTFLVLAPDRNMAEDKKIYSIISIIFATIGALGLALFHVEMALGELDIAIYGVAIAIIMGPVAFILGITAVGRKETKVLAMIGLILGIIVVTYGLYLGVGIYEEILDLID